VRVEVYFMQMSLQIARVTTCLFLSIFQYDGWFTMLLKAVVMCTSQRSPQHTLK